MPSLHWFRRDLRLGDNPGLVAAAQSDVVIGVYIWDDQLAIERAPGGASRWWLDQALRELDRSMGGNLWVLHGSAVEIIPKLVHRFGVEQVSWNRVYEHAAIKQSKAVKHALEKQHPHVNVISGNASLLREPWSVRKPDGNFYQVFTPFRRRSAHVDVEIPAGPSNPNWCKPESGLRIDQLPLLGNQWYKKLEQQWDCSESAARERWDVFVDADLVKYENARDWMAQDATTILSPYIHFGQICVRRMWHDLESIRNSRDADTASGVRRKSADLLQSQLLWREFSYAQSYQYPNLDSACLRSEYELFPWSDNTTLFDCWKHGQTGIPIVDAGMHQLWETGYMHNRVRMIVASFLVKNLMIDWRKGCQWFWDTLLDADLANNGASWQWVAGCGRDAAPYFRIFNPVTQARKFDPDGDYIRRWIPQLRSLPAPHVFAPWEASSLDLASADVHLGKNYPEPIVDLRQSRQNALDHYNDFRTALRAVQ